ncbi:GxxExxY protein [Ancylomarina sp. DW003]|nr:GxxExxY protein [Ancylomarina sp. DW003]MDE5423386.1 GxxExxY protein [Ancylomarina sp. DW003]
MEKNSYIEEINKLVEVGNYIYKQLGHGCKESIYKEVLELELELRNIPYTRTKFESHKRFTGKEKFLCFDKIFVGLDTHSFLSEEQENTFMNSLRDVKAPIGVLFNFGYKNMQYIKVGGQCVLQ